MNYCTNSPCHRMMVIDVAFQGQRGMQGDSFYQRNFLHLWLYVPNLDGLVHSHKAKDGKPLLISHRKTVLPTLTHFFIHKLTFAPLLSTINVKMSVWLWSHQSFSHNFFSHYLVILAFAMSFYKDVDYSFTNTPTIA